MKRLSTGVLTSLFVASLGLMAVAAPASALATGNMGTVAAQATPAASAAPAATPMASPSGGTAAPAAPANVPPMQFGSPPSGEIPILFNDHHVYTKPDTLRHGRVLAALVRGGTVLVPLRSMFEQMGATVSFDPGTKTVDVTKAGADVKVTVGKPEVTINGESRPLDVPPMMYHGQVLVPVRVISEGMGAYVQWVPDQHVVVVRYLPPTPPPPPAPPAPVATTAPTPTPAPAATPYMDHYIAGDYLIDPKVYNEFSPGNEGKSGSYAARGAFEFNLFNLPWMIAGDYRQFSYPHNCPDTVGAGGLAPAGSECNVTVIGGLGSTYVNGFTAKDQDLDGRVGLKVLDPHIYIAASYVDRTNNYGYPSQTGVGFGLEKLPDLNHTFSLYGSAYYYPSIKGTCSTTVCPTGPYDLEYQLLKYQVGGDINVGKTSGIFLDFGWMGDSLRNKLNAPAGVSENGPYVGLGIHF